MKENTVFSEDSFDKSYRKGLSLLQIYCAELLLSMEHNKHSEAFEVLQLTKRLIKDESDGRAIIINSGLSALLEGNYSSARDLFYGLLIQNPKDFFALYVTHMIEFNNGMTSSMLETLHAVREYWEEKDIFYGYCKGIEAFILNENGFYIESRDCGEEAITINPDDIYAIHAICHHYFDNEAYQEGRFFMEQLAEHWKNNYACAYICTGTTLYF
jgi:tetratricopeptide (TPR) repeat protein